MQLVLLIVCLFDRLIAFDIGAMVSPVQLCNAEKDIQGEEGEEKEEGKRSKRRRKKKRGISKET